MGNQLEPPFSPDGRHYGIERKGESLEEVKVEEERKVGAISFHLWRNPLRLRRRGEGGDSGKEGNPTARILVIGDSNAAGVGASGEKPLLPAFLARTLTRRLGKDVSWISSGVVGGSIDDVRSRCLDMLEEQDGEEIKMVVVIVGPNGE